MTSEPLAHLRIPQPRARRPAGRHGRPSSVRTCGKIHDPVWAVIGNLGDSQCYLGVPAKVAGRPGRAVRSHRRRRPGGPADPPGVHARRLRRSAQRHAADAVLADRPRAGQRRRRRAPGGQRRGRAGRRRGVRQAAGRDARRRARAQRARRSSSPTARSSPGSTRRPAAGSTSCRLPGGRTTTPRSAPGTRCMPARSGQLRRHVHLQHDADLHRRARPGAAAHGVARRRTTRAG